MIDVMHILTDSNIGGAGIYLANYLENYDRDKFNITVVLPTDAQIEKRLSKSGVRIITAQSIKDCSFSKKATKELYEIIKKEKPHIVHTHASLSARIAAFLCGTAVVHTRHCLEEKKKFPKSVIYRFINNLLSTRVIAVSKAVYDNLVDDGIKKDKLSVIYNGITPLKKCTPEERENLRKSLGIPKDAIAVGLVARLEDVKNPVLFANTAKEISRERDDIYFVITGGGSLKREIDKICNGVDNIILTGYREDVQNIYNLLDIITLTSKSEALSISLLEGMSIGLGAVSTASGGPEEIIENNVNGLITKNGDINALKNAILYLADNPNVRKQFGTKAVQTVAEKFGVVTMARKTEKLYEEIYLKEVSR